MLQRLDEHITACHLRAQQCRAEAELANDATVRVQLEDLEQQWLRVARSYEFIESLERFLLDSRKDPVPPGEELPTNARPGESSELHPRSRQTAVSRDEQLGIRGLGERRVTVERDDLDQPASVSWWAGGEMPTDEGYLGGGSDRQFATLRAAIEFVRRGLSEEERLTAVIVFDRPRGTLDFRNTETVSEVLNPLGLSRQTSRG
jgi:hypothetical protein